MRVLGILTYEDTDIDAVLSRLPKKEGERLRGKAKEYILSSAMGRLLLFSLCDRLFGADAYEKEVAYRARSDGKGGGSPYVPSMPNLFLSIAHTEGACAVVLSNEGECGVDIESLFSLESIKKERLEKITRRFYLSDFQTQSTINSDNIQIIVYIFGKNSGELQETKQQTTLPSPHADNEKQDFLQRYTAMEAVGKAFGLGVAFLPRRQQYLTKVNTVSLLYGTFVLCTAWKK